MATVSNISKQISLPISEKVVIIPFLIEFKVWSSQNPCCKMKIPFSRKEYAKLSTCDLKSNPLLWENYSDFAQKLFNTGPIKKETRFAIETLGLDRELVKNSSNPCEPMPEKYIEIGNIYLTYNFRI